jgi:hypothetical protein
MELLVEAAREIVVMLAPNAKTRTLSYRCFDEF